MKKSKYIGFRCGTLEVINCEGHSFVCKCDCGNIIIKDRTTIIKHDIKYCCKTCPLKPSTKELSTKTQYIGQKFGTLTIIDLELVGQEYYFKCKCDCGSITIKQPKCILDGTVTTCGFKCSYYIDTKRKKQTETFKQYIGNFIDGYQIVGLDFLIDQGFNKTHFIFKCPKCGETHTRLAVMIINNRIRPICTNVNCNNSLDVNTKLAIESNSEFVGTIVNNLVITDLIYNDESYPFNYILKCECLVCGNKEYLIDCKRFRSFPPYACDKCNTRSRYELLFIEYLNSLNINYEVNVRKNSKLNIQKHIEIDFLIGDIGIELNGLQTHATTINKHNNPFISNKPKNYHLNKTLSCDEYNIDLLQFWNVELNQKSDIVKSIILNRLGRTEYREYARNCYIKEITKEVADVFLESNHIQGKTIGDSIRLGLFYKDNNNLVSVMTFGYSRYGRYQWEMFRFCNMINCNVVGSASKLFKYFIKYWNPTSIISYSDRRIFNSGRLYETLGFKFSHNSDPGYWYCLSNRNDYFNKLYHRSTFMKHKLKDKLKLFDPSLTEWENMENNGYLRVYDCGNKIYTWKK